MQCCVGPRSYCVSGVNIITINGFHYQCVIDRRPTGTTRRQVLRALLGGRLLLRFKSDCFTIHVMKIHILGTGTAIPRIERNSSAYLITAKGLKILVDAGPAVVRRALEKGFDVDDIDIVIITHFHVDHTADLSTFFFACNYGRVAREKPLTIIGGKGITRFYRGLRNVYPWIEPKTYDLTVKPLVNQSQVYRGVTITTVPVRHNPESIAVRFDERRSVTFSGDTDFSQNLIKLADRADLFVAECAFPERKVKGHLNLESLDRIVQKAMPKRVLLTHLYPEWDTYKGVLHAPYLLAEDGMEMEV